MLALQAAAPRAQTAQQAAQSLRLAVHHTELRRDGPGLLLRDIRRQAPDVLAVRDTLAAARPDVVLLLGFDYDLDGLALAAFAALLAEAGHLMPHRFALRPNRGMATGIDLDGDGRTGTPDDAQGWGRFTGAGGMAILSQLPIRHGGVRDHSDFLWRDLPGAMLPSHDGRPFPSAEVFDIQRLASTGYWLVPVALPGGGEITLMSWHAGPPAFGGPHGRNRLRNHDENTFWVHLLDDRLPMAPPAPPFVLMGNANLGPERGEGMHRAMRRLLAHPALQDPSPTGRRPGGPAEPDTATAHFPRGPGVLRGSYILPDAGLHVLDSGLIWPPEPARHALVWADIALPGAAPR
ncbi:MAG: endonuclease/exonuclease/phosphatase family protein [Pararhodobacter sp.]|nr:endonuclease/exonuclease/phosphatase family protein [Pararhodobacter sp.]